MKSSHFPRWIWVRWVRLVLALCTTTWFTTFAGVTSYGFFKGKNLEQTGPATVVDATNGEAYGVYAYVHSAEAEEVLLAQIQSPGNALPIFMAAEDDPAHLEFTRDYESPSALEAEAANGAYRFQILDSSFTALNATLNLGGDNYPVIGPILNFTEAQSIDPTQPFTLRWSTPPGFGLDDFTLVSVWNSDGNLYSSPQPWGAGALPGTTTSYTIPAGILAGEFIEANVVFIKVTQRDSVSVSGATGFTGYFASLMLPLQVKSGGGGDTTKPVLTNFAPGNLAQVDPGTPLVLDFSEPMQPIQKVAWPNLPSANFMVYAWSNGGQRLTCTLPGGFPGGSTIVWGLDAATFKDLAGNTLAGQVVGGTFTIQKNVVEPCANGPGERRDFLFVAKEVSYAQRSALSPTEEGDPVARFGAFFTPGAATIVSAASVTPPGGSPKPLSGLAGRYFTSENAQTEAALNTTFPSGNYTGTVSIAGQAGSLSLAMAGAPPVPMCLNYASAQTVDSKAAFTLQWSTFDGAGANDRIEILVSDDTGQIVFQAPNECSNPPVLLSSAATSITLPPNLLAEGKTYNVQLTFMRVGVIGTNTVPSFQGVTAYLRSTHFTLKTGGGSVLGPVTILNYRMTGDGHFEVDAQAAANQSVALEGASDFRTWSLVASGTADASGHVTLKDNRMPVPSSQQYRLKSP